MLQPRKGEIKAAFHITDELTRQNHWNVNRRNQNQLLASSQPMTSAQKLV